METAQSLEQQLKSLSEKIKRKRKTLSYLQSDQDAADLPAEYWEAAFNELAGLEQQKIELKSSIEQQKSAAPPLSQSELPAAGRARTDADPSVQTLEQLVIKKQELEGLIKMAAESFAAAPEQEADLKKVNSLIAKKRAERKPRGVQGPAKDHIKILCFDLDETILTSADPSVHAGNQTGLTYVGQVNIASAGDPDMADVVVNSKVIGLLEECTKRDNIKWFIVSRGNNTEKLDVFMQYCDSKGKRVIPDNEQYGINPFNNKDKKATVRKIIDTLSAGFKIDGVLFADDDENNVRTVASLGDIITPINIPQATWNLAHPDDYMLGITLLTDANIGSCEDFIGVSMAALKKRKKTRRKSDKSKKKKSKKKKSSKSGSTKSKKNKKAKKKKVVRGKKSRTSRK